MKNTLKKQDKSHPIKFDDFSSPIQKEIYKRMWKKYDFTSIKVEKKLWRNVISNNSYCFSGKDKKQALLKAFNIKDKKLFSQKYTMAVSGDGSEEDNITTLHSSALCSLLFFYDVSKENPLSIKINGKKIQFIQSIFEYKNQAIGTPSNIDVVLISDDYETVVFLESKFSEYIKPSNSVDIPISYLDNKYSKSLYTNDVLLANLNLEAEETFNSKNKEILKLTSINEVYYVEGIKQMISHYIGIRNLIAGYPYENNKEKIVSEIIADGALVYLGEILFDNKIGEIKAKKSEKTYKDLYAEKHHILAKTLNEEIKKDNLNTRFIVLEDVLSYDIFKNNEHILEPEIHEFYFGLY